MKDNFEYDRPPVLEVQAGTGRWTLSPKRGDWLRRARCVLTSHRWDINSRGTQRVCYRCWTVDDTPTPTIDRDEIKAVLVTAGDAPAEQADAVVAYLAGVRL